jgi:hypothetical protein
MLRFMVWVPAVATLPLFGLSLALEGAPRVSFDLPLVGALLYIAGISTLAGFAVWGALIRRYEAATVRDELRGAHPARAAAPDRPARRCACRGRPLIWLVTADSVGA